MTRDDIIRMARKAGYTGFDHPWLHEFAALAYAAGAAAEREACAKVVEADPSYDWHRFACQAAAAIRARGQA